MAVGGWLAIHDVFPDPADGGRPPYDLWRAALASGQWVEDGECGSLRVLRRVSRARPERAGGPRAPAGSVRAVQPSARPGALGLGQVERGRQALAPEQPGGRRGAADRASAARTMAAEV